uniref:Uncharacterized protein n=1 Tax=Bionectria ochroleuca TaxID=29856 RepID=A0A0B7JPP9_BIOOC
MIAIAYVHSVLADGFGWTHVCPWPRDATHVAVVAFASRLNCPHQPLVPCSAQPQLPVAGSHLPPCADWIQLQSSMWWRSNIRWVRIKDDPELLANSVATFRRWSQMMQEPPASHLST